MVEGCIYIYIYIYICVCVVAKAKKRGWFRMAFGGSIVYQKNTKNVLFEHKQLRDNKTDPRIRFRHPY